jgi:hypothetical protein
MASEERVTESYSDLNGPLTKEDFERLMVSAESWHRRNTALVALCEELLRGWLDAERANAERSAKPGRANRAIDEQRDKYRARLAKLKGAG